MIERIGERKATLLNAAFEAAQIVQVVDSALLMMAALAGVRSLESTPPNVLWQNGVPRS
jgi:hypothetical protein